MPLDPPAILAERSQYTAGFLLNDLDSTDAGDIHPLSGGDVGCKCFKVAFHWYNHDHYHTGLTLMTPAVVHYGLAETVRDQRNRVLQTAYVAHPERFVRGAPVVPDLPREVWINPPTATPLTADIAQ